MEAICPRRSDRAKKMTCDEMWFNRFRKLLVQYEKFERSFLALNHLAASIMALRKIKLDVNNYGQVLSLLAWQCPGMATS